MKCSLCSNKIEETFLGKIIGTFVIKGKKRYPVCFECQRREGNERENVLKKV